jgi:hypothetical protein
MKSLKPASIKKIVFISIVLLCIPFLSFAQKKTIKKSGIYYTWIDPDRYGIKDILYQIRDSSIIVADCFNRDLFSSKYPITKNEIGYKNINTIKIRSKHAIIIGTFSCAILGSFLGAGIGFLEGDDPHNQFFWLSAKEKSLYDGILGGLSGAAIGALLGSIRITIPINRSIETFNNNKEQLKKYSYMH